MKKTLLTRKEVSRLDLKYICSQSSKNKYFVLNEGWVGFKTKKEAQKYLNYIGKNKNEDY